MTAPFGFILGACPVCGGRKARVAPVHGGFKVACDPDQGGCGCEAALGETGHEAARWWNAGALRHSPMAEALIAAAARRQERAAARIMEAAGAHHG